MSKLIFIQFVILLALIFNSNAQVKRSSHLFIELKKLDSIFFERSFNQCDLDYLENTISEDLRFFHDQSGYSEKNVFLESIKKNICANPEKKPIRKLKDGSLTVFPLYNNGVLYGAIQSGIHNFFIREKDKKDRWTSTARFTSVWLKENENWKLTEVLSYDHHDPEPEKKQVENIEDLLIKNNVPALGLGVIENGKLTKVDVYGTLDKKRTAPYNTIFRVASLTKPIVTLTALKLIDKGMLELDEPLYKYWIDPDLKHDKRYKKLTPRIVLTHQTGFPNWRYMNESKKLAFQFDPGERYQYSGEGFEYLRKAIEKKFNKGIEDLAKELIFNPLGMVDTKFYWDKEIDESRYASNFDAKGNIIEFKKYYTANAATNVITTIEDYSKFIAYVLNGAGLSSQLFTEMQNLQIQLKENDYFGLGWEILTGFSNDEYALLHTGREPGVSSLAIFFPKSKNGYVIFMNGDNVDDIYEYLVTQKLYLGKELWERR